MSFFCKQKLRVYSKVKIIDTDSHHAKWIASQNEALLGDENYIKSRDRSHLYYESIINYDLDITNILVVSPQIRDIKVFDIMNPRFNEQIWLVPSDFGKSRFHCTYNVNVTYNSTIITKLTMLTLFTIFLITYITIISYITIC